MLHTVPFLDAVLLLDTVLLLDAVLLLGTLLSFNAILLLDTELLLKDYMQDDHPQHDMSKRSVMLPCRV